MAFENTTPRTGNGEIWLVLDWSAKAVPGKPYWAGVAFETNDEGNAYSCKKAAFLLTIKGHAS